ncbi:SpoIIE family protein phosphatase [Tissierella sp. Yu-01]|uniref:SpoIIE family protein phosphatase n=1 Tax=Tissierella sp. Yu-01 TaxID=3035694 RepID=UPI00240E3A9E|nr:SpoIIE family protein phosphatase [Tissierella sp. Yu-01]WFA07750.1 SpoIIE family protein phosphatase [Tissierella sp. Yu-01]
MSKNIINFEQNGILNYHVLDGMADWVRVVDKNGTIIFANSSMKKALGDAIVGMQCYKAYCREKRCTFCITTKSIISGEVMQKEEIINGRYYSVKSSPVINGDGKITAAVEVFRDVTRERKLELELIERNKKMRKDLQFAKKLQEKILPPKGTIVNINIDYIYKASEMLSGDMFDIFQLDDENIGIYISDVAGHGIAASMMTMFIRQTMRGIIDNIISPSDVLTELHRTFTKLNLENDKYFTMFYGIYNKVNHEFRYTNAGHNCIPVKFNERGYELLEMKGFPIAKLFDEINYDEKKIKLCKGDKILFYTDGITEAKDHNGMEFGVRGILDTIEKNPNNLLEEIENKYIYHSWGEQDDDYALVLMEVID